MIPFKSKEEEIREVTKSLAKFYFFDLGSRICFIITHQVYNIHLICVFSSMIYIKIKRLNFFNHC